MRRLSRFEYDNTVRDLLGEEANAAGEFPPDELAFGFDTNASALMFPPALAEQAFSKAESLASRAAAQKARFAPCAATETTDACARQLIEGFGLRALRRPLSDAEHARYLTLLRSTSSFDRGFELVAASMLISLPFFYRAPPSTESETGFARASLLSYALWGSTPDDALLESARLGHLDSEHGYHEQAQRIWQDDRARRQVAHFHGLWLGLDGVGTANKDPQLFPGYASELLPVMRAGMDRYLDEIAFQGAGLSDLLVRGTTYADERLAALFGFSRPGGGNSAELIRVSLPEAGTGLLAQPGLLAMLGSFQATSPTRRGAFVRARLLCDPPSPPPPDVDVTPPSPSSTGSRRSQIQAHTSAPACSGCHQLIDPIGFGFEAYDAAGRYRTVENGAPPDVSGFVERSAIGAFTGLGELSLALATDAQVARCFAKQWFRFLSGRQEDETDAALLDAVAALANESGEAGFRPLLLALVTSPILLSSAEPRP